MAFHIELEILVSTLVPIYLTMIIVDRFISRTPLFVSDSSVQVDVSGFKDPLIEIVVKRSSTYRNIIRMNCKDVAERLSSFYERRYHSIKPFKFPRILLALFLRDKHAFPNDIYCENRMRCIHTVV